VGYHHGPPLWWSRPILAITAFAIVPEPGNGGHIAAAGLQVGGLPQAITLPGMILAGLASIGMGLVLGPEGPLIAPGGRLALVILGVVVTYLVTLRLPPSLAARAG
jgi:hypothetical protein